MRPVEPILVAHLFSPALDALLALLSDLSDDEWSRRLPGQDWTVKDLAAHLLADEIGVLAWRRDGYTMPGVTISGWAELVTFINRQNATWVEAMRRLSPAVLCDLLRHVGSQANAFLAARDPFATGVPVDWAGPEPAPIWLDIAREYTERWYHQQQMRAVLGRPGLTEPQYMAPVLDTFLRALPHTYRDVVAVDGTAINIQITGEAGGNWVLLRRKDGWALQAGEALDAAAQVSLPGDTTWRLFSRGITVNDALSQAVCTGSEQWTRPFFNAVAIIA